MTVKFNKVFHIGLEVPDIEKAIDFYVNKLGFIKDGIYNLPEKNLKVAFLKGDNVEIELMHFDNDNRGIFTSENPSCFNHLAFEVEDINIAMNELAGKGIVFDYEKPIFALDGKVCYNTFRGPGNELLEIAEIQKGEEK